MSTIKLTAGRPLSWRITFKNAKNIWDSLNQCEIRAQFRTNEDNTSPLIANLHDYMTLAYDGNDIYVQWTMNGAQTRALYDSRWGNNKTGYVNFVLSDIGTTDTRGLPTPVVQLIGEDMPTKPGGAV